VAQRDVINKIETRILVFSKKTSGLRKGGEPEGKTEMAAMALIDRQEPLRNGLRQQSISRRRRAEGAKRICRVRRGGKGERD